MADRFTQYFERHAEPESRADLGHLGSYHSAIVLPARDEAPENIHRVVSALDPPGRLLVALVANAPPGEGTNTATMLADLHRSGTVGWRDGGMTLLSVSQEIDILTVDRCASGHEIPPRQGVGLARKIGADIVAKMIRQRQIEQPWIFNTDADVVLPADYLRRAPTNENSGTAALVYPFEHVTAPPDGGSRVAALLYEISLEYYVAALAWCGSPYAFHTVGSTIAVNYDHYVKARGFPKRNAGEDFYLLNKVAKLGRVETPRGAPVRIDARPSRRVPFGTGPALGRIEALANPAAQYGFYHPDIFEHLRVWQRFVNTADPASNPARIRHSHPPALERCLTDLGAYEALARGLVQYARAAPYQRYLADWFDAFRTLKLIHCLRDRGYPSLPLGDVAAAPFLSGIAPEIIQRLSSSAASNGWLSAAGELLEYLKETNS